MTTVSKRATIYFDPDLHNALRLKAVVTSRSVSKIVNDAVREALSEDAEDLAAFEDRAEEPYIIANLKSSDVFADNILSHLTGKIRNRPPNLRIVSKLQNGIMQPLGDSSGGIGVMRGNKFTKSLQVAH